MEVRDGFIVGVYDYCDAWCDTCAFTSRCRVFADLREMEAAEAPHLKHEHASRSMPAKIYERQQRGGVPERDAIDRRADGYLRRARAWLRAHPESEPPMIGDPRAVVSWFHMMIHVKAMRALRGLEDDEPPERDWPADHDGSAKVALVGIDRSETAWRDLVALGLASPADATSFIDDLSWLRETLERVFPRARSFIRPGFDEPAEVARLSRGR